MRCAASSAFILKRALRRRLRFELSPRDLSMVTEAGDPIVAEGDYSVSVGGGQPHSGAKVLSQTFKVKGKLKLPE